MSTRFAATRRHLSGFAFGSHESTSRCPRPHKVVCSLGSAIRERFAHCLRALARRDITVPIGIDKISAISLYEASSTSQSNITSRKAMGSCSIALRIVSERERSTSMDSALVEFTGKRGTTSPESSGTVEPRFASEHEVRKVFFKI